MGISKYVSDIQYIDHNDEIIFNYLSDFQNLSKYLTDDILAQITEKIPQVKIGNFHSDQDSCSFNVGGFGMAEIRITEREPFKTIKVQGKGGIPVALTFWVQLMKVDACKTKMRLTLHTEMGMMAGMMVGDKLEKGINKLAETLAKLPYK
jgi:carbon monoxide dehydrogenase subunit G